MKAKDGWRSWCVECVRRKDREYAKAKKEAMIADFTQIRGGYRATKDDGFWCIEHDLNFRSAEALNEHRQLRGC